MTGTSGRLTLFNTAIHQELTGIDSLTHTHIPPLVLSSTLQPVLSPSTTISQRSATPQPVPPSPVTPHANPMLRTSGMVVV